MRMFLIAGARPNFMKIAPLVRALEQDGREIDWRIVHTGQHYDHAMSQAFFDDLGIPAPHHHLHAGSGSHAQQTAKIMTGFEELCERERPDLVLVVGDVNSTLACSIVAKKLLIAVAHVEAGLRSGDMTMPEEINRMVTDAISDLFFTTEEEADANLLREGKPRERIHFVGHVMVDNLLYQRERLRESDPASLSVHTLRKKLDDFAFLTLHRPATVDDPASLNAVMESLGEIARRTPVVFPVHPRTRQALERFHITPSPGIHMLPPLPYRESLYLWQDARAVLTDSGGLQEETTALGIPCLTLRDNTERPVTITRGTNTLVGTRPDDILAAWENLRSGSAPAGRIPPLWDGHAAERIVAVLHRMVP